MAEDSPSRHQSAETHLSWEAPLLQRDSHPPIGLAFAGILFLPTLFLYFQLASSFATGTLFACIVLFGLLLLNVDTSAQLPAALMGRLLPPWAKLSALIMILLLAHALVASLLQPLDYGRLLVSLLFVPVLLLGGWSLAVLVLLTPTRTLVPVSRAITFVLLGAAFLAAINLWPVVPGGSPLFMKSIFPFTEPSLLALAVMPFYMMATVGSKGMLRLLLLALGPLVILTIQNLTLAVGWLLVLIVCSRGVLIPLLVLVGAVGLASLDLSYFIERVTFSGTENLSALVYLQGWEMMLESLGRSHDWGLGFQQLGVHGTEAASSYIIFALLKSDLNLLDGGFTAAKLISEFGVFGGLLVLALLILAFRSFRFLRHAARTPDTIDETALFVHAVPFAFLIELLVRSTGYYTGTVIMLLASLILRFASESRHSHPSSA